MFYGTASSYIEFANEGGLDTRYSITMMCWVQPGGQDGLIFSYGVSGHTVCMKIEDSRFFNRIVKRSFQTLTTIITAEVLPAREWVHVAASYDHNSGNNSLYINGHLRASQNIGTGYHIATATQKVRMGVKEGNSYFKGKIAEMKVYNFALNEAQIQTSISQGSCSYCHVLFLKLLFPYPLWWFPFWNCLYWWSLKEVADNNSGSSFAKQRLVRWQKKWSIEPENLDRQACEV